MNLISEGDFLGISFFWETEELSPCWTVCDGIVFVDVRAARACIGRITSLDNEVWCYAVEDCIVVCAIEAVLEEVPACQRCLLSEERYRERTSSGMDQDSGCWWWFCVVVRRHVEKR